MSEKKLDKKITIEDILKRKDFFKNKKNETMRLNTKSLGEIVIEKPDVDLLNDLNLIEDEAEGDKYFVYEIIKEPNLHDEKLLEGFGCKSNPCDIVHELFDVLEVSEIARKAMSFAGLGTVTEIEEIKN